MERWGKRLLEGIQGDGTNGDGKENGMVIKRQANGKSRNSGKGTFHKFAGQQGVWGKDERGAKAKRGGGGAEIGTCAGGHEKKHSNTRGEGVLSGDKEECL